MPQGVLHYKNLIMNACLPYFPFGIKVIQKYSVHNITRYSRVTLNFVCLPIHQEFFVWIYSAYLWIVSCLINFKSKEFCLMFHHMQNKPIVKLLNEIKIFSIRKFWENFHRNFFIKCVMNDCDYDASSIKLWNYATHDVGMRLRGVKHIVKKVNAVSEREKKKEITDDEWKFIMKFYLFFLFLTMLSSSSFASHSNTK